MNLYLTISAPGRRASGEVFSRLGGRDGHFFPVQGLGRALPSLSSGIPHGAILQAGLGLECVGVWGCPGQVGGGEPGTLTTFQPQEWEGSHTSSCRRAGGPHLKPRPQLAAPQSQSQHRAAAPRAQQPGSC